MKFHILLIITLLIFSLTQAQQKLQSHTTDFNILGKVKSFTSTTKNYKSINDLVKDSDILFVQNDLNFTSEYKFNEDGFLYESKTDEVGYTWKKYEFSKAKKPLVIKISVLKKDKISAEYKKTIVMVTHDPQMASYCSRLILLKDGVILEDLKNSGNQEVFYQEILGKMKEL